MRWTSCGRTATPRPGPGSEVVRIALCLALALACGAVVAETKVMIGGPSRSSTPPKPKTPAQLAQEREEKARETWREQRLQEKLGTLGKHREAEARRQVEMEEASRRARGLKFDAAPAAAGTASAPSCRDVDDGQKKVWKRAPQRASVERTVEAMARQACMHRGGHQGFAKRCKPHREKRRVPVPGNPLKFTVEMGPQSWECEATFRCAQPKRVCEAAGAVRQ